MKKVAEVVAAPASAAKKSRDEIKKLALIGTGKLGEGLLAAMLQSQVIPTGRVECTVAHQPRADYLCSKYGVKAHTDNIQAVKDASLVLIALKPQQVKAFLNEVRKALPKDALIVSAAASVTTSLIERELGHPARVIRAMPNTPCLIRQGMTALAGGKHATAHDMEVAHNIFSAMGRTVAVDEKHMDAITALSASGPAYVYLIIESLAEAGVKLRANAAGSLRHGAPHGRASGQAERRGHHAGRLHHRRIDGTGRRPPAGDADQGRSPGRRTRPPACGKQ
jgi:pyrroline-5-carboxylate reductase